MRRTNLYPVRAASGATVRMLSDEPIRIDGMRLVFDEKVAVYPVELRVEENDVERNERRRRRARS